MNQRRTDTPWTQYTSTACMAGTAQSVNSTVAAAMIANRTQPQRLMNIRRAMSTITYLTAKWCQPCKTYLPLVRSIAADHGHTVHVLDIDEPDGTAAATAAGVLRVPALLVGDAVYLGPRTTRQLTEIVEQI